VKDHRDDVAIERADCLVTTIAGSLHRGLLEPALGEITEVELVFLEIGQPLGFVPGDVHDLSTPKFGGWQ
jgi:hypothetical protein